jgi:hypothetical protein
MLIHHRARLARGALALALAGGAAALVMASAAPALATYPVLTTPLTGPAINGVVPAGQAEVNQCHLPKQFGTLTVNVQSVNLPDRTQLTVNYGGLTAGQGVNLGSFTLSQQSGKFSARLSTQAGPNDNIAVMQGSAVILSNPARWATPPSC